MKKNKYTCRWKVEFKDLAYDMGVADSWTQYYFTWLGAQISKLSHLYIRSWGGKAELSRTDEEIVELKHPHSVFCEACGGWESALIESPIPDHLKIRCRACATIIAQIRTDVE